MRDGTKLYRAKVSDSERSVGALFAQDSYSERSECASFAQG
ncbi:hypothetical protein N474_24730 [Pseudoalteromonas luteoviolacea CPMOR-2]|nr:hypothetical protein N474_24730 [Pseudoalteromonas luteoviolacea CPMOR-2]